VNRDKSGVARPWTRHFRGYLVTGAVPHASAWLPQPSRGWKRPCGRGGAKGEVGASPTPCRTSASSDEAGCRIAGWHVRWWERWGPATVCACSMCRFRIRSRPLPVWGREAVPHTQSREGLVLWLRLPASSLLWFWRNGAYLLPRWFRCGRLGSSRWTRISRETSWSAFGFQRVQPASCRPRWSRLLHQHERELGGRDRWGCGG